MNKNVIIGLVLIVAAAGGYYLFGGKAADVATEAAATATTAATVIIQPRWPCRFYQWWFTLAADLLAGFNNSGIFTTTSKEQR